MKRALTKKATNMKEYQPNRYLVERTCVQLMQVAVGCMAICPFCKAKCTENNPGHTYHSTDSNRMSAFAGLNTNGTPGFTFNICTSVLSRDGRYRYYAKRGKETLVSFDEIMEDYKWTIPLVDDIRIEDRNIIRLLNRGF